MAVAAMAANPRVKIFFMVLLFCKRNINNCTKKITASQPKEKMLAKTPLCIEIIRRNFQKILFNKNPQKAYHFWKY
jgi:hypothetical protein